jgi:putative ABC transport system permease protein
MRTLWRWLIELFLAERLDRDSAEEMSQHVESAVLAKMRSGMTESEARRQARIELGSIRSVREQLAEKRARFPLEQIVRELLYAARVLRSSTGITVLSVAAMGVGIGASGILFALVDGIVLRPLPYPDAGRLVRIFDENPQAGVHRSGVTTGNLVDWRRRSTAFAGIAGYYSMGRTLSTDRTAEVLIAAQVTDDFFSALQVAPILGRTFTLEEVQRAEFNNAAAPIGPDPVAVLSFTLWRQHFSGDPTIVGRTIVVERRPFRVVGVMPERFAIPDAGVQLWIPWGISLDSQAPRDQHYVSAVARLKPGISMVQAEAELNRIARDLAAEYPSTNRGWGVSLASLADEVVGETGRLLWILLAAVGLVLLVACANVALLSVMRGLDRSSETSVRIALGASSTRLLRQFVLESLLLAALGGALGVLVATAGVRLIPVVIPRWPRINEVALDGRVLGLIAALTVLAAIVSGLPAAWRRIHADPVTGFASGTPRTTMAASHHVLRDSIVTVQVALAVVLLAASGVLVRSFVHLRSKDSGFNPTGVLVLPIFLDSQAYRTGAHSRAYYARLFERLSALPGVTAVGGATTVPTSPLGPDFERPVWPEGSDQDHTRQVPASVRVVTPGYFSALELKVLDGRTFTDGDRPDTSLVLMVSETLARQLWPSERAVGKRLVVDYSTAGTYPYEVVGVVGDVRFRGPKSEPSAEIYMAHAQRPYLILNVTVRSEGDPRRLIPAVQAVLKEIDPQKPAHGINPLAQLVGATLEREREAMMTLLVFGATSVFLAVMSVYGALSQRVRERSREIGLRIAMGANPRRLIQWVAWLGLRIVAVGIAVGLAASWLLSDAVASLLVDVAPTDPVTGVAVTAMVLGVGLIATLIPSWRATRIDPAATLRRG